MEIISVVSMNGPLRSGAQPEANMWWAHTVTLRPTMAMMDSTAIRKLYNGFRANTAVSSISAVTAGMRMTYTSGWPISQKRFW